jgi:hypothetical protein
MEDETTMATTMDPTRERAYALTQRIGTVIPIAPHDGPNDRAITLPHPLDHQNGSWQVSILSTGPGAWQITLMVDAESTRAFIAGTAPTKVEPRIGADDVELLRRIDAALDGQLVLGLQQWGHLAGRRLLRRLCA